MRRLVLPLLSLVLALPAPAAPPDLPGRFDYYVLALSWSPTWCATEGGPEADQCRRPLGFTLHGLWPQDEAGWPEDCATDAPDPTRRDSAAMADIMGSPGLAWYQWKKHGRCSGLSGRDYYRLSREAFRRIRIPEVFRRLDRDVKLPVQVVEEAFSEANPGLTPAMMTVSCTAGRIDEVRICLTRDLVPRPCGADIARDCRLRDALMEAVR